MASDGDVAGKGITLRIGTKRFSIWIILHRGKTRWHSGKYTVVLAKGHYIEGVGWGWTRWRFIPLGRKTVVAKK